jgi:hypothetical protein
MHLRFYNACRCLVERCLHVVVCWANVQSWHRFEGRTVHRGWLSYSQYLSRQFLVPICVVRVITVNSVIGFGLKATWNEDKGKWTSNRTDKCGLFTDLAEKWTLPSLISSVKEWTFCWRLKIANSWPYSRKSPGKKSHDHPDVISDFTGHVM